MSVMYIGTTEIPHVKASKQKVQNRIVSTLLDGSEHVQMIGEGVTRLKMEVIVDRFRRDVIDEVDATGGIITVVDEGVTYEGRIIEKDEWEKVANDIIRTNIVMSVEVT